MRPDSYRDVVTVTVMYCAVRATGTPKTEVRSDPNAIGPTVLALAMFAAGRGLLRMGVPKFVVRAGTLLSGIGMAVLAAASLGRGATGHAHPLYTGIGLWGFYFGPVPLNVLALHGLHKLLDNEGISWRETVVTGWHRTLDLASATSRAEFWGFATHCAWLWALARICLVPLDRWIGLVLLLPLATLAALRLRSIFATEMLGMSLTAACIVLLVVR